MHNLDGKKPVIKLSNWLDRGVRWFDKVCIFVALLLGISEIIINHGRVNELKDL